MDLIYAMLHCDSIPFLTLFKLPYICLKWVGKKTFKFVQLVFAMSYFASDNLKNTAFLNKNNYSF